MAINRLTLDTNRGAPRILGLVLVAWLVLAAPAHADDEDDAGGGFDDQWKGVAGLSLSQLIARGGEIVSTDALMWPGGRSALLQYVRTPQGQLYRCADFKNLSFEDAGFGCDRLKAPPE